MTGFPDHHAHAGDIAQSSTVHFHVRLSVVNALNERLLVFILFTDNVCVKSALFKVF